MLFNLKPVSLFKLLPFQLLDEIHDCFSQHTLLHIGWPGNKCYNGRVCIVYRATDKRTSARNERTLLALTLEKKIMIMAALGI